MSTTLNIPDIAARLGAGLSQPERDLMTQWAHECTDPNRAQSLRDILALFAGQGGAEQTRNSGHLSEK